MRPCSFSHVGLTVTDLEQAVRFYTGVFGCYLIMAPTTIQEGGEDTPISLMCREVFGAGWGEFRIAHLSFADRVGLEIFEFPNSERRVDNFDY